MNLPFEKGQDMQHVQHAYRCLKNGSRLVAIMSPHFTYAMDSKSVLFREWLDGKGTMKSFLMGRLKSLELEVSTVIIVIITIDGNEGGIRVILILKIEGGNGGFNE